MKNLKFMALAVLLAIVTSCGSKQSSAAYNPEKCAELKQMIDERRTLTSSDYDDLINQMTAATLTLADKKKEFGDDKEALQSFLKTDEGKQLVEYSAGFAIVLGMQKKNLSADNLKNLIDAQDKLKVLKEQE